MFAARPSGGSAVDFIHRAGDFGASTWAASTTRLEGMSRTSSKPPSWSIARVQRPEEGAELLDASEKQEIRRRAAELKQVERRLDEAEADFAKNVALLKRDVLDEAEFRKANEARRDERARLTGRQTELTSLAEACLAAEPRQSPH